MTSSSLSHSFRTDETEPATRRIGNLTHYNNFGTLSVDWQARTLKLDLRASDDCGLSTQHWHQVCEAPGSGVPGTVLMETTVSLDALVVDPE